MANVTVAQLTIDDGVVQWEDATIISTAAGNHAVLTFDKPGGGAGDAMIRYQIGSSTKFTAGLDDSVNDDYYFAVGGDLGTNNVYGITSAGDITFYGASYNVQWDKSDNSLEFKDGASVKFGNAPDMTITHSSNQNTITLANDLNITGANVGIGTATPEKTLHIHEATSSTSNYIRLSNDSTGSGANDGTDFGLGSGGNLVLWNKENTAFHLATNNTERFHITAAGNVGIGTTAPDQKLTVGGHILLVGGDADNANKYSIIANEHYDTDDEEWPMISGWSQAASHTLAFGGYDNAFNAATSMLFYTAANVTTRTGTLRMTIDSGGNVGIGAAPSYKLHVEGGASTRAFVKSTTGDAMIQLDAASDAYII